MLKSAGFRRRSGNFLFFASQVFIIPIPNPKHQQNIWDNFCMDPTNDKPSWTFCEDMCSYLISWLAKNHFLFMLFFIWKVKSSSILMLLQNVPTKRSKESAQSSNLWSFFGQIIDSYLVKIDRSSTVPCDMQEVKQYVRYAH